MSFFSFRRWGAVASAGLMTAGLAFGASVPASASTPHTSSTPTVSSCLGRLYAGNATAAKPAPGSASTEVTGAFSVFQRAAAATDALPPASRFAYNSLHLADFLGYSGAANYDPDDLRLLSTNGADSVYVVPVTMRGAVSVPAACTHLPQGGELQDTATLINDQRGTGAGICTISVGTEDGLPSGRDNVQGESCVSSAALSTYWGALEATAALGQSSYLLTPDDVASLSLSFSGGGHLFAPSGSNLVPLSVSQSLEDAGIDGTPTRRQAIRLATAALPTAVTETDASGAVVTTLPRPADAVSLYVNEQLAFAATSSPTPEQSSGLGFSGSGGGPSPSIRASCTAKGDCTVAVTLRSDCNAKTKRCATTTETTKCTTAHVCTTTVRHGHGKEPSGPGGSSFSSGDTSTGDVTLSSDRAASRRSRTCSLSAACRSSTRG